MKCLPARYKLLYMVLVIYSNILYSCGDDLPSILWDPRNPLFSCKNPLIIVKSNDRINFVYQQYYFYPTISSSSVKYYNKIYLVKDKQKYESCDASEADYVFPKQPLFSKVVFTTEANSDLPSFPVGKTYYFISTSDGKPGGAGENQKINGSCAASGKDIFPLKLAIRVCTNEEYNNGLCDRCTTASCYAEKCTFGEWEPTSTFVMNQTSCLERMIRKCQSTYLCDAPEEKYVKVEKDKCSSPGCSVSHSTTTTTTGCATATKTLATTVVIITTTTSISVSERTSIIRETITETITRTATISNSVTVPPPQTRRIMVYGDIVYDKKFYITVVSAILGALLVGVFVCHACVSYYKGKNIKRKVVNAEQYTSLQSDSGSVKKVNYGNGTINTTHA